MDISAPLNVHVELTFGCNRKCVMCYKQVLNKSGYDFMSLDTARVICSKLRSSGWNDLKIKFALRGEPLLNPDWFNIIKLFREELSDSILILTTNGDFLNPSVAERFFEAGGNFLMVDCYHNTLESRKRLYKDFNVSDYYSDDFDLYTEQSTEHREIILIDDLVLRNGERDTRVISNHGGNIDFDKVADLGIRPLSISLLKFCMRPFRDLMFFFDGSIPLCCEDSACESVLGNVFSVADLNDLWFNSSKLDAVRYSLNLNFRLFKPCRNCDYNGG